MIDFDALCPSIPKSPDPSPNHYLIPEENRDPFAVTLPNLLLLFRFLENIYKKLAGTVHEQIQDIQLWRLLLNNRSSLRPGA